MYSRFPTFILGFHGCDQEICEKVLLGKGSLRFSKNYYDWLGNGIYFWENNPQRALEYAESIKKNPARCNSKVKTPAVIGAIIDLGNCLNLVDSRYIKIVENGYELLKKTAEKAKYELPKNTKPLSEENDLLIRELDCAVIESIHQSNQEQKLENFDTVRGIFEEGKELYPNAGFKKKSHIQVCVRNPNCIKGYFLPREQNEGLKIP